MTTLLLAAAEGLVAIASRHKAELLALVVLGAALVFATPLDRYLIAASAVTSGILGHKIGASS